MRPRAVEKKFPAMKQNDLINLPHWRNSKPHVSSASNPSEQIESFLFGAKGTGPLKVFGLRFLNASLNRPFKLVLYFTNSNHVMFLCRFINYAHIPVRIGRHLKGTVTLGDITSSEIYRLKDLWALFTQTVFSRCGICHIWRPVFGKLKQNGGEIRDW